MNIGGNDLAIGVSLIMRDGFTAQATRASAAMGTLNNNANQLARSQAVLARNSNAVGAAIGATVITGISKAYQEFARFDDIVRFTALTADGTTKALDNLSNKALEVGKRTIFSSKEIAEGMRYLSQAGFDSKSIVGTIDSAANLAAATMSNLSGAGGAADLMAKIGTVFNVPRDVASMSRLGDVLAYGANESLTDLYTFGEGMKYAQNSAIRLKYTLEETTAAIMVLNNAGISGTMAGTTIDNMNRYFTAAAAGGSPKKNAALASMGMTPKDLQDAQGNLLPIAQLWERIGEGLKNVQGTVGRQKIIDDILGARGAKGDVLANSMSSYNKFVYDLQNINNYAGDLAQKRMESAAGAIDVMKSTWETLKIQFGGTVAPLITPILRIASRAMDVIGAIAATPVGKVMTMFGAIFVTVRTAQMAYRAVLMSINLLQNRLGTTMSTTGSITTSNFGRMTAAANAYSNALNRINMAMANPGANGVGRVGQYSHGGYYQVGPGGGYIPLTKGSYKPGLAKWNNLIGKGALPASMLGMLMSMGGESMGKSSGMGSALSIGGDTLGYAGTGAMIGSIIPGIGTTVGAIIGGVGGLMYSLYSNLKETNDEINGQKNNMSSAEVDKNRLKKELAVHKALNWKDRAWLDMNTNMSGEIIRNKNNKEGFQKTNTELQNTIILQVEGIDIFSKRFQGDYNKETINLGIN